METCTFQPKINARYSTKSKFDFNKFIKNQKEFSSKKELRIRQQQALQQIQETAQDFKQERKLPKKQVHKVFERLYKNKNNYKQTLSKIIGSADKLEKDNKGKGETYKQQGNDSNNEQENGAARKNVFTVKSLALEK